MSLILTAAEDDLMIGRLEGVTIEQHHRHALSLDLSSTGQELIIQCFFVQQNVHVRSAASAEPSNQATSTQMLPCTPW